MAGTAEAMGAITAEAMGVVVTAEAMEVITAEAIAAGTVMLHTVIIMVTDTGLSGLFRGTAMAVGTAARGQSMAGNTGASGIGARGKLN